MFQLGQGHEQHEDAGAEDDGVVALALVGVEARARGGVVSVADGGHLGLEDLGGGGGSRLRSGHGTRLAIAGHCHAYSIGNRQPP